MGRPAALRPRAARLLAAVAVAFALAFGLALLASAPAAQGAGAKPAISAPAAIVIDARTGEQLYARAPHERRAIASTTKLMTALITLARTQPDTVFTAPPYPGGAGESTIGLRAGERMSVRDLLRALMLPSANDAAYALAVNIGGTRRRFVRMMNAHARDLGLVDTHYSTPVGLDDPGNYSTAADLAKLASLLIRDRTIARTVNLPSVRLETGSHERRVINRNDLVARYRFVDGIKTGHTSQAGYVLVGAAHGHGAKVVSVVLGTSSETARDADSLALLRYGVAQFRRVRPVVDGRGYASAKVRYYDGRTVRLVAARDAKLTVRRGRPVRRRVMTPEELEGPIAAGQRVGSVQVLVRGQVVRTIPLVTEERVEEAGFVRKATATIGGAPVAVALLLLLAGCALLALRMRARRKSPGGTASNDHHRHAERRDRQDARGSELPPRAPPPGG